MERSHIKRIFSAYGAKTAAAGCGFVLSATPLWNALNPFGIALLCASERERPALLLGCLAALPLCRTGALWQALCLLGCFFALAMTEKRLRSLRGEGRIRALLSPEASAYPASVTVRVLLAGSCALLTLLGHLLSGQTGLSLLTVGTLSMAMPFFCYVFCVFLQKKSGYDRSLLGIAFVLAQVCLPFTVASVPLPLAIGLLCTLSYARCKGFAYGCAMGLLCGLTSGGAAMGALGVAGITYGLLVSGSETLSLLLSYMIAVSGYWYLAEASAVLPAALLLALSFLLFLPIRSHVPLKAPPAAKPLAAREVKLETYAAAFSSLSGLFYTVSDTAKTQSAGELYGQIRTVVNAFCRNCEGCELQESELCNCFAERMREDGTVRVTELPLHLTRHCPSIRSMARAVNRLPDLHEQQCEKGIRRMASEYADLSCLLTHAARREESARIKDKAASSKVRALLRELKIDCEGVRVTGLRERVVEVYGVCLSGISASSERISATLSEALGVRLSEPEFLLSGNYAVMRLHAKPRLRLECAKSCVSKSGETVCGDTASFFETEDGYFYCLLSDGMGSGKDAALSSRLAILMLEKLLRIGADKADALQMLNKTLRQKDKEVFATVDLLEIDRFTGMATLIKAGAAPTLLFRDGNCRRFESKTPPTGIMREVIAEKRTFPVRHGDLVVMVSDGVLQTGDQPLPLRSLPSGNAHAAASRILSSVHTARECADDMSVCVLRVV